MQLIQEADVCRLIELAKLDDPEAFGQLYQLYAGAVYRYLLVNAGEPQEAEDLTIEVFIHLWKSLPSFQDRGVPFIAFLFRIAKNVLIDNRRRFRNAFQVLPLVEHTGASGDDPAQALLARQKTDEILSLLSQLHAEYQQVLVLRFLNEFSIEETAQIMGKSSGAVRVLQHRALASLRKLVGSGRLTQ